LFNVVNLIIVLWILALSNVVNLIIFGYLHCLMWLI